MYKFQRIRKINNRAGRKGLLGAALVFSLIAGGCSTDVSRFDLGKYGGSDDRGATGSLPPAGAGTSLGDAPVPSQGMAGRGAYSGRIGSGVARHDRANSYGYRGPDALAPSSVRAQQLPDIASTRRKSSRHGSPGHAHKAEPSIASSRYRTASRGEPIRPLNRSAAGSTAKSRNHMADAGSASGGKTITVARGDTLYGLSRRHSVSIAALKAANGLRSAMIRPGQKLRLPGTGATMRTGENSLAAQNDFGASTRHGSRDGASNGARKRHHGRTRNVAAVGTGSSYKVRSGDSIYRIAREYGLKSRDLLAANPDVNPRRMRPGQMLRIPGSTNDGQSAGVERRRIVDAQPQQAQPPRVVTTTKAHDDGPRTYGKVKTRIINKKKRTRVASLRHNNKMNDATPAGAAASQNIDDPDKRSTAGKFRWPVKGRMIAKFGSRSDGTQNDGINILVPKGTAVKAAENGVVAYAGDELKGYGNLILVRHQDNWVTAYAHNSNLKVKRGDKVRRGQVIASAGTTGTVDRPQLHFELRKGSKPVDPLPYLR